MKHSVERILTTHVGSLPRPASLMDAMQAGEQGKSAGGKRYDEELRKAVTEIVRKQVEHGLDVVNDGEYGKPGFIQYINQRLTGFEQDKGAGGGSYWGASREARAFPEFYEWQSKMPGTPHVGDSRWLCTGPIKYQGQKEVERDLANLKGALKGANIADAFMPAVSPGNAADWNNNRYYKTDEEYLLAIADALHVEYKAIVDAGFLLQVDDPLLATYYVLHPEKTVDECRKWARVRVEALNRALEGIPEEKIRYHTCYSINIGPRVHDMELKHIIDIMLSIRAGAYSFEAANPRHEHEWKVWMDAKLPDGKILIPGVITHASNIVEHPELVAERLVKFANIVGRENVIAGADCGFASSATSCEIHPTVVWAKFTAMNEGAQLASRQLWGR